MDRLQKLAYKYRFHIASFFLPVIAIAIGYAFMDIRPFGKNSLLAMDLWGQYFPMLSSPGGSLWSFNGGLGFNAAAQAGYYTNSPFNLILYLLPQGWRIDAIDWFVALRAGLAGLTFCIWLKNRFGKEGLMLPVFALCYAVSSYFIAFISQIMWLDAFWLLPLIILGIHNIIQGKSHLLYVLSLFTAIFSNFYIAFAVCIFCLLYFLARTLSEDIRRFPRLLLRFGICSLCAGGMAAAVILPVYSAIQNTLAATMGWGGKLELYHTARDFADAAVPFTKISLEYGVPNIYCALACIPLFICFILSRRIPLRRRIAFGLFTAFMLLSFNLNLLDYVWHGFHYPNQLPGRQSFLFIFLILTLAFEGLLNVGRLKGWLIIAAAVSIGAVCIGGLRPIPLAIMALTVLLIVCLGFGKRQAYAALAAVMLVESGSSAIYMMASQVRLSDAVGYNKAVDDIIALTSGYNELNTRMEVLPHFTFNTAQIADYKGITWYSSTMPGASYKLFKELGCAVYARNVSTIYVPWPALNAIFGVGYIADRYNYDDAAPGLELAAERAQGDVYRNKYCLPLGFTADDALLKTDLEGSAADAQNAFFRDAAGASDIYTLVQGRTKKDNLYLSSWDGNIYCNRHDASKPMTVEYTFNIKQAGEYMLSNLFGTGEMTVTAGNEVIFRKSLYYPSVWTLGELQPNTKLTVSVDIYSQNTTYGVELYLFDGEALGSAVEDLSKGGLEIDRMSSERIEGRVNVGENDLFFLSIPYDEGWRLKANGKNVELFEIYGGLTAARLPKGEVDISLSYTPPGLLLGSLISAASLAVLAIYTHFAQKKKKTEVD